MERRVVGGGRYLVVREKAAIRKGLMDFRFYLKGTGNNFKVFLEDPGG